MENRCFAFAMGSVFVAVGTLGFLPDFWTTPSGMGSGDLLGMAPASLAHNLIFLLLGIWGLATVREVSSARRYARGLAIVYSAMAVLSVVEGLGSSSRLAPIVGLDIGLQIVTALFAAYFGWAAISATPAVQYARRR